MSQQISIKNYFTPKSRITNVSSMDTIKKHKKRSLSLIKTSTPEKNRKVCDDTEDFIPCIDLSTDHDDSDDFCTPPLKTPVPGNVLQNGNSSSVETVSDSSSSTVIYSLTPSTSRSPQKPLISIRSPGSINKFYSPTKKRNVTKRTPSKVKRNLTEELKANSHQSNLAEDEVFREASNGMDDKTVFLLTIINKYLKEESLRNLLDEGSQTMLLNCLKVVKPGMSLVCRLYWYKWDWYKQEKLKKIASKTNNIDDLTMKEMLNSLIANGLITAAEVMSFEDLTKILSNQEMKQICKEFKLKVDSKKSAIEALQNYGKRQSNICNYFLGSNKNDDNHTRVLKRMTAMAGPCYKLSDCARTTFYKLYLLMYLGMDYSIIRDQRLELMLINEKIKRETYPIDKEMALDNASVVFETREEFERYVDAHKIYEDYLGLTDTKEKCDCVIRVYSLYLSISENELNCYNALPPWLLRYTPVYKYVKILDAGIQELKKDKSGKHYQLALEILNALIKQNICRQNSKADWYAEKALILHSLLGHYDEAAEALLEGFESNLSEEIKDHMRPRARKIANQKNAIISEHLKTNLLKHVSSEILERNFHSNHVYKQPMGSNRGGKVIFQTNTSEEKVYQHAEDYCITYYTQNDQYTHGEHWEGRIVITLFHLLFWDIIYSKPRGVRGLFLSHYQLHPLDMYSDSFYVNRKILIDARLEEIEKSTVDAILEEMHRKWEERPEYELSGIIRAIGWDDVRMVSMCLRPRALAALCRRLACNYGYAHSGFPDLTLWNILTRKIKFVEVKTDSDKPSVKQLQWMSYLTQHGIDAEFCYVGANTARSKARGNTIADRILYEG